MLVKFYYRPLCAIYGVLYRVYSVHDAYDVAA